MTGGALTTNRAYRNGGAIYNITSNLEATGVSFQNNQAGTFGNGGAIYNQYNDITLTDANFIGNQAGQNGGAVYNWAATVNLNVTGGVTSTLAGNSSRQGANSFHLYGTGAKDAELLIDVGDNAVLDMQDPISGEAGSTSTIFTSTNVLIEKNGAGLWKLGGFSSVVNRKLAESRAVFNLNAGGLHLYGQGEVANSGGQVGPGVVSLAGPDSQINIGAGVTLTMGGQNGFYITSTLASPATGQAQGQIAFAGNADLGFDLSRQSAGDTSLELKAANITIGGRLNIDILALGGTGRYVLLHKNSDALGADFNSGNINTNVTYRGRNLGSFTRGISGGLSVSIEDDDTVVLNNTFENRVLTWTNPVTDWTLDGTGWQDEDLVSPQNFFDGDLVNFDGGGSLTVDVEAEGLITAGIYVSGAADYSFSGGGLTTNATATTLAGASGKLVLGQKATGNGAGVVEVTSALFTGTLDLTGQTDANNFTAGIDIHSGALRVANVDQIGGDFSGLRLMSASDLWDDLDQAISDYVAAPNPANLAGLNAELSTAQSGGLATLKLNPGGDLTLSGQRLTQAAGQGGGLDLEGSGLLTWTGNSGSLDGGALSTEAGSLLTLSSVSGGKYSLTGNYTTGSGGALYNRGTFLGLGNSLNPEPGVATYTFLGNTAETRGGAVVNEGLMSLNSVFFARNRTWGDGGAVYNSGSLALTDFIFRNNVVGSSGRGGAVYNSGILSLGVSAGAASYFGDNRYSGGLNSIFMESGPAQAQLNVDVDTGGSLWMYDPMAGQAGAGNIEINKTGDGLWGLSGENDFQSAGGGTVMNIEGGTLHLSGGGAPGAFRSDPANIRLGRSGSQFNIADATLLVGGDNSILSEGQINLNDGAVVAVESGQSASLTMNEANLNGAVEFRAASGDRLALEAVLSGDSSSTLTKIGDGSLILARTGHTIGTLAVGGGTLGLVASSSGVAVTADSVTFGAGTTLDISGYSGSQLGDTVTLIQSNSAIDVDLGGDRPTVTIGQNAVDDVDFISADVLLADSDKKLNATIGLTWYNTSQNGGFFNLAHGDFTLNEASGGFKLGTVLEDRTGQFTSGWNGRDLTKKGAGILLLTGDNTYSGKTTIEDGILAIYGLTGSGLNQADKEVEIQSASTLELNLDQSGSYHKLLTGSGGLTKAGDGLVTLTNDNSGFNGLVKVVGGGLTAVRAESLGTGAVENSALVNLNYDGLFNNYHSGSGTLATYGDLTLTGDHSGHSGLLAVQAGRLTLGGPDFVSGAAAQVNSNAVLAGQGSLGSLLVRSGGVVSPGQSIGTINITDDLEFEAGGVYVVELDLAARQSDRLVVGGVTTISPAALLRTSLVNTDSLARGTRTRFKIIDEDTFADDSLFLLGNRLGWNFQQMLEADGLYLVLLRGNGSADGGGTAAALVCSVGTPNACRVAQTFDRIVAGGQIDQLGSLGRALESLSLDDPWFAAESFLKLTGEIHPSLSGALQERDRDFVHQLRGKLEPAEDNWPLWVSLSGLEDRGRGSSIFGRGRLKGAEAALGASRALSSGWTLGGALRFGDYDYDYRSDTGEVNGLTGALFAQKIFRPNRSGQIKLFMGAGYGRHQVETKRRVDIKTDIDSFFASPQADYDLSNFQLFGELAYLTPLKPGLDLEPYLGLSWSRLSRDSFVEKDGLEANLKARALKENRAASELGLRLSGRPLTSFDLTGSLGWRHLYGAVNHRDRFSFAGLSEYSFPIEGAPQSREALVMGLEAGYELSSGLKIEAEYNGRLGDQSYGQSGTLRLIYNF